MVDQILSQADVDALVASLNKSDAPKAAKPLVKPAAQLSVPVAARPLPARPAASAPLGRPFASVNASPPSPTVRPASATIKSDVTSDMINGLNFKIAELTRQLGNMGTALNRIEVLEKKISELEANTTKYTGASITDQKVQQLTDEMKKIITNLKSTPGYGVRNTFSCEKCDDHGHVAVQFRCTKCGHDRWYGWFPDKKK